MTTLTIKTEDRDLKSLCRTMIVLRMICVGVALSLIAFFTGAGFAIKGAIPVAGLLLVVFPLSAIWWLILRSGYGFTPLIYSQLIADIAVETGIVYYTGGTESHFTLLYLVTILLAGVFLYLRGAVLVATVSALSFSMASLLEKAHVQSSAEAAPARESAANLLLSIGLQVVFFYLAAVLSGRLSQKIRAFGMKLKSAATELEKARMDTRLIIESMNSGLITVNSDCIITEFNKSASAILGIRAEQAIGRHIDEVVKPVSPELGRKLEAALKNAQEEGRGEAHAITADGRRIPLGVSVSLLGGDDRKPTGVVLVFQDLTEVKTMTERIRLADRLAALGELSAAIAHEIRTPLASICGSIEMLRDSLVPEGQDRKLVDLVIKESERLREIIDHFLQFARSKPARFGPVTLNSVLTEVVCMVKNHPHFNRRMTVELHAPSTVTAWVDEETIKQVFYNLALNAIEALGDSGRLSISLDVPVSEGSGDYACVRFEDNGKGIEEADLERIFEPFFTRKKAGTGLGLAIASKIVEEHGGKIDIRSTKGVGTVATVYLPLDRVTDGKGFPGAGSSRELCWSSEHPGGVISNGK